MTPQQRNLMNLRDAMKLMSTADLDAAAKNPEFPAWAKREYLAEAGRRRGAETPLLTFWRLMNAENKAAGLPELTYGEAYDLYDRAKGLAGAFGRFRLAAS